MWGVMNLITVARNCIEDACPNRINFQTMPDKNALYCLQEYILQYKEYRKYIHERADLLSLAAACVDHNIRDDTYCDTV